jgi:hypothetical protein
MANTSKMTREERKDSKRKSRKALKLTARKLTPAQRDELEKKPKGGVKGFLLGTNQEIS